MPLLSRRKSTLDMLIAESKSNNAESKREPPAPVSSTAHLEPPLLLTERRPASAHGLLEQAEPLHAPLDSPPSQHAAPAFRRFNLLKSRNFSDSALATRARLQAQQQDAKPPLVPAVLAIPKADTIAPAIITTAPTMDLDHERQNKKPRSIPFKRQLSRAGSTKQRPSSDFNRSRDDHTDGAKSRIPWRRSHDTRRANSDARTPLPAAAAAASASSSTLHDSHAPPAYGDDINSHLALPLARLSDSSRSDRSSGEHTTYATTTTTHTVSTTTTLFKLPRRKKHKSLFPLPVKVPPATDPPAGPATPRASTSATTVASAAEPPPQRLPPPTVIHRRHTEAGSLPTARSVFESPTHAALAKSSVSFAAQAPPLYRKESSRSIASAGSHPTLGPPQRLALRDRASTMSSFGRNSVDFLPPSTPPTIGSTRNSTSTTGRSSLGGFLTLNRFRHGSDPHGSKHTSPGARSKSNSFALSREALIIPDREEGDTPGKYLERLQATVSRSLIAGILSKSSDPFAQAVLRSYTRRFAFFGEPIDMSLRKFLLEAELPKETQQVDRVIQAFADRYHECNPGIFTAPDKAYIIAFSLMMLHTDAFNKNNKRKMQKSDYVKNTSGQQVSDEVLACFYDNICYTPFIHFDEEDIDINGERLLTFKPKKSKLKGAMPDQAKKPSGPIDPYALICDGKLDVLRPLKDSIVMHDPYSYLGSTKTLDLGKTQRAFLHTGVLQIMSARSRPAAFETQANRDNPAESKPGVVDLKITKVGILWRKSTKRKKARSPWQEWGALLTGSQIYLFKNVPWVKGLMHQQSVHSKHGQASSPVVFKPPISDLTPDAMIKIDNAVALLDASYTRHKHALTLIQTGEEEVLLAETEAEMNEWLALINYAASFRSARVRIRGFIGGTEADGHTPDVLESPPAQAVAGADTDAMTRKRVMSPQLSRQVMALRRSIMQQKISENGDLIAEKGQEQEDTLRNARHLQILAPIQPKTREAVINAAAQADTKLKWARLQLWRATCHRDILSLDLKDDHASVVDHSAKGEQSTPSSVPTSTPRKTDLQRLNSKSVSARSPTTTPQSPTTANRSRTTSSGDMGHVGDVFRTPPERAQQPQSPDTWRLPPLDTSVERNQHRQSVTSIAPSHLSRQYSVAHASSTSSLGGGIDRLATPVPSDAGQRPTHLTPTPSTDGHDHESMIQVPTRGSSLAKTTTGTTMSSTGRRQSEHAIVAMSTPESATRHKSGRRSLHRTLRDAYHEPGSAHRHRKSRESGSTVKSELSKPGDAAADGTPGLERTKAKFIVHGKQASVITFGGDWTEETMRAKREADKVAQASLGLTTETEGAAATEMQAQAPQQAQVDQGASPTEASTPTGPSRTTTTGTTSGSRVSDAYTLGPDGVSPAQLSSDAEAVPERGYFDLQNALRTTPRQSGPAPGAHGAGIQHAPGGSISAAVAAGVLLDRTMKRGSDGSGSGGSRSGKLHGLGPPPANITGRLLDAFDEYSLTSPLGHADDDDDDDSGDAMHKLLTPSPERRTLRAS